MKLGPALRFASAVLALAALGSAASAQVSCERYRAELASLNRAGASIRTYEAAAQRQRNELARLIGYYRSIGCDQASFLFFQPPAECGGIAQRIRALQANATELAQQATADPSAVEARGSSSWPPSPRPAIRLRAFSPSRPRSKRRAAPAWCACGP